MPGYQYRGGQPDPHRPKMAPPVAAPRRTGATSVSNPIPQPERNNMAQLAEQIVREDPPPKSRGNEWIPAAVAACTREPGVWFRVRVLERNAPKSNPASYPAILLRKQGLRTKTRQIAKNPDCFAIYAMHPAEDEA